MSLVLASLVLNEAEHLDKLYRQHRDWPGLDSWIFVEAADRVYAKTNPDMVTSDGLSVDGTSEFLRSLAASDSRVKYIPYGFSEHRDPAQGKVAARQAYIEEVQKINPKFLVVLDADEMYTHAAQRQALETMEREQGFIGFMFHQRHIWRPPSIADKPLFRLEVTGGYWSVPHARGWRWKSGYRYSRNHNWLETADGRLLNYGVLRRCPVPECVHLGYASSAKSRIAKSAYYVARGENVSRPMYVQCRQAWQDWKPGSILPSGASVREYKGPVPECFKQE